MFPPVAKDPPSEEGKKILAVLDQLESTNFSGWDMAGPCWQHGGWIDNPKKNINISTGRYKAKISSSYFNNERSLDYLFTESDLILINQKLKPLIKDHFDKSRVEDEKKKLIEDKKNIEALVPNKK
jgi:hypothetical protein